MAKGRHIRILRTALAAAVLPWIATTLAAQTRFDISVLDQSNQPVSGVRIELKAGNAVVSSTETDSQGRASFTDLRPGRYEIVATKQGYELTRKSDLDVSPTGTNAVEFTLIPAIVHTDSVDVRDAAIAVEQGSSAPAQLSADVAKQLPSRPATVSDALPLLPGVVRRPDGGLQISGAGEHRSALIVNSADVTDPATGQFGLTVPIDSVEVLNVYQTSFLAEYGRFTEGLVSVETKRGGEKWKWELNDPLPDFRIRSWDLRGLRDATPRLNFEGPLIPGKLYFSEGLEYEIRKTEVYELPFPNNQKRQEGVNSFAQLDWIISEKQLFTATVHVAPQRMDFVNLDYFNPEPTTPDASTRNYTTTVADHLSIWGGLLDNTISATRFDARVWGQGPQDLTITPEGNSGDYFSQQDRRASRIGWASTYSFAPRTALGTHSFKVGSYIEGSSDQGNVSDHPIDISNSSQLLERITFSGGESFRKVDTGYAFFGQDHWLLSPRVSVDLGVRTESQAVSESFRVAPRAGIAWNPFARAGTVIRAGFGLFYDRVPLNVYAFDQYPSEIVTLYGPNGLVTGGPFLYQNSLGQDVTHSPFVIQDHVAGNFSPRSANGSIQVEQPLTSFVKLRVGYTQSQGSDLIVLNRLAPDPTTNVGADVLSGNGVSRYRQFEATARVRLGDQRQLFFSYVRSRARGDLNDFNNYLGSFPVPVIRNNLFGSLPTDLPNRFLAWGVVALPWGFRIAPVFEYRTGFPYAATDALQNYAGAPYSTRFPSFVSLGSRFSKDFKVNPKYTVRFSVSAFNLTDHFNPEAVHNDIADPAYGFFFGQRGRRFTADFDVIF